MARASVFMRRIVELARRVFPDKYASAGWLNSYFRRSPIPINEGTALSISTFWGCCQFVSGQIMQLPCSIRQKKKNGKGSDARPDMAVSWMVSNRANPEMSAPDFWEYMINCVLVYGNAYAEIEPDGAGRPYALWPLHPRRVTPDRMDTGELYYKVAQAQGGPMDFDPSQIFHISGRMTFDGIVGMSIIDQARRSLGLAISSEEYGSSFFSNSGIPSAVLQHPKLLSETAQARLKAQTQSSSNSGPYASQNLLVLEEGSEYKVIGLPPEQAQFLETRGFTVEEICRWFGVPPSKVGHFDKISYNSAEQLSLDVISECLMPLVRKMEQEIQYKLLSDGHSGLYAKFDMRSALRTTHKDRAEYYKSMQQNGDYSINEVRELEDMNQIDNGDIHFIPLNMASLDDVAAGKYEPGNKVVAPAPAAGTTTDGQQPQKQEPNPPQPPKTSLESEEEARRNARWLQLLDQRFAEIEEYERTAIPANGTGENVTIN